MELNAASFTKLLEVCETLGEIKRSISDVETNLRYTNQRLTTLKNRVDNKLRR